MHHCFTRRELAEAMPEHNRGLSAVPQILTKDPEDFLWAAGELQAMGYEEVNLNLGCPSGTVTAKGKGAGFLARPRELDCFLEEVFEKCPVGVSVKTRLGMEDPAEFEGLLDIFNRYPIRELIIHPRVRRDLYKGPVRMEAFQRALSRSRNPVCYNGDLRAPAQCEALTETCPGIRGIMLGRGLLADPGLAGKCRGLPGASRQRLESFYGELTEAYIRSFGSERNAMLRLKELWSYQRLLFKDSDKLWKMLRKTQDFSEFQRILRRFFTELELLDQLQLSD